MAVPKLSHEDIAVLVYGDSDGVAQPGGGGRDPSI
jgi:hypothetical protein